MDDKFENKIREVFEDTPDIPFQESAWHEMEKQLSRSNEQKENKKGFFKKTTWILPLFLVAFCFGHWSNSVLNNRPTQTKQLLIIDTVIQKHELVIFDTIYKSVIHTPSPIEPREVRFSIQDNAKHHQLLPHFMLIDPLIYTQNIFSKISLLNSNEAHYSINNRLEINQLNTLNEESKEREVKQIASLRKMVSSLSNREQQKVLPNTHITLEPIHLTKRRIPYYLHQLLPKQYGIFTKLSLQHDYELSFEDINQYSELLQIGIQAYITSRLSINLAIGNQVTVFQSEDIDNFNFRSLPIPTPQNPNDIIDEAKGVVDLTLIPFGLNYHFRPKKRFRPYLGIGLYARQSLNTSFNYTYITDTNASYQLKFQNLLPNNWKIDSYWLEPGFSYSIRKHWQLLFNMNARLALKKGKYRYENPKAIGASLGFGYYW